MSWIGQLILARRRLGSWQAACGFFVALSGLALMVGWKAGVDELGGILQAKEKSRRHTDGGRGAKRS